MLFYRKKNKSMLYKHEYIFTDMPGVFLKEIVCNVVMYSYRLHINVDKYIFMQVTTKGTLMLYKKSKIKYNKLLKYYNKINIKDLV